jgi:flagellar basal-body rod protein FlgC
MTIASTIAASGLTAASLRLRVAASNIANSLSNGPLPEAANIEGFPPAYSALRVNQTDRVGRATAGAAIAASPAIVRSFDPTAPFADAKGMVAAPNVDLASDVVQMLLARYSFTASALVIRTDTQMSAAFLDTTV